MSTLGYSTTPTAGIFSVTGSNTCAAAIQATMPSPGGVIVSLSAYFRAADSGSHTAYLCVWDNSGNLLANASVAINGGEALYTGNLATPLYVAGSTTLYIGFCIGSVGYTVEHDSTGTSYSATNSSTAPSNCSFGSSGFDTIEAYATYYLGGYVNTGTSGSPVWTAGEIYVNTGTSGSPVWTPAAGVYVNTGTSGSPVWTPSA